MAGKFWWTCVGCGTQLSGSAVSEHRKCAACLEAVPVRPEGAGRVLPAEADPERYEHT